MKTSPNTPRPATNWTRPTDPQIAGRVKRVTPPSSSRSRSGGTPDAPPATDSASARSHRCGRSRPRLRARNDTPRENAPPPRRTAADALPFCMPISKYNQPENRLTHALYCAMAHDRKLIRPFLTWLGITDVPPLKTLRIVEQHIPGEKTCDDDGEGSGLIGRQFMRNVSCRTRGTVSRAIRHASQ